jgi:hypothetical protein
LPWEDPQFFWLDDPRELSPAREEYGFSRHLTFPRTMVLNHRLLNYGRIPGNGVMPDSFSAAALLRSRKRIVTAPKSGQSCTSSITWIQSTF